MDAAVQGLLDAVLALPERDRADLAQAVLQSLDSDETEVSDEELDRELARRADELRTDPTCAQPWSEVKKLR